MLWVSDGRRTSSRTASRGKYALPSTVTMSSDCAITVPFQVAVVMTRGCAFRGSPAQGIDGARLRRPARPAVTPGHDAQGVDGSPHSGHSTVSPACALASLISLDRS